VADILDMRVKMAPPAGLSRGKAFDAARQHSRRVRLLRFAVPVLALAGVLGFVGYAIFDPFGLADHPIEIQKTEIKDNRIVMESPHLTGYDKKQQAYNVTATSASQLITSPDHIDLQQLEAVISALDKSRATLTALVGKFDSGKEILNLENDVRVKSTKGYSVDLSVATVDFKAGTVESNKPVVLNLTNGTIKGGGLSIANGGDIISFKGGVSSRFQRPPTKGAPAPSPDAPIPSPNTQ
jgi:lipopolysaccharide export system protein LptC